jgi:hypothetical protein
MSINTLLLIVVVLLLLGGMGASRLFAWVAIGVRLSVPT